MKKKKKTVHNNLQNYKTLVKKINGIVPNIY